jgi:YidC/Oxa1 family membrane protein insertase
MEQARLLIAIALSFLVFLVWSYFFTDRESKPTAPATNLESQKSPESVKEPSQIGKDESPAREEKIALMPEKPTTSEEKERTITVDTPYYSVQISERGASFKSFVLKDYRETVQEGSSQKELISEKTGKMLKLFYEGQSLKGLESAYFKASASQDAILVNEKPLEISFTHVNEEGVSLEKKYIFSPNSYIIELDIVVKNASPKSIADDLVLAVSGQLPKSAQSYGHEGPTALINGKLEQVNLKKVKEQNQFPGKIQWLALEDQYFMTAIIPKTAEKSRMRVLINNETEENQYIVPNSHIDSGSQQSFEFLLFFGPKSTKVLKTIDYELGKVIDFGYFDLLAKPLLWFMNFIFSLIPNYGVAIIILTIVTKVVLWPLGNKSYKSMNEMKRLQPLMAEIREKYKNDKKMMNQETMALYRTYKVNPMGGCLPMVLQIPVFFALYRMLYQAIELRHAPFIFWINDLSAPDRLFHFSFSIPFMQPPFGIPVLTIIMGATMLLQQKMSPPPGDPTQAKMMMFMPIVFTFIFINFSSGLVLYWLVNNILSIAQQYYIQKKYA